MKQIIRLNTISLTEKEVKEIMDKYSIAFNDAKFSSEESKNPYVKFSISRRTQEDIDFAQGRFQDILLGASLYKDAVKAVG